MRSELQVFSYHGISGASRAELAAVLGRGRRLLTVEDTIERLGGAPPETAKKLARWCSLGWLRRVRRGLYIPVPIEAENPRLWTEDALYLADAVWSPCYFTGWTAAGHWSLTEQLFRTTVVRTTLRARASRQHLLEHEFLVGHVPASALWGVSTMWRHERRIHIADPARTVIDLLVDPSIGGGIRHVADIVRGFLDQHESDKLIEYGDRLGNGVVFKRLGFIIEKLGGNEKLAAACRDRLASGYPLLDPGGPKHGRYDAKWGLRINAPLDEEGAS